ncbi:dihydrolipoamide acetyltransferase family protein [Streptomyces sp. NPDC001985]|uniref:dihydrolipoamide acetyltransferase family protein n=1 Tax=Streptomyces sp. NPDC001985 TaxID=3154406 RepID=UPI00332317E4
MPDVGEGLTEAEILKWYVQPGDTVTDGQVVCEVETAKAAVELPIPYDGVVHELNHAEGTTVDVGQVIIRVDTAGGTTPESAPEAGAEAGTGTGTGTGTTEEEAPKGRTPVLVGYGVAETSGKRRPRKAAAQTSPPRSAARAPRTAQEAPQRPQEPQETPQPPAQPSAGRLPGQATTAEPRTGGVNGHGSPAPAAPGSRPLAKPPVRKLAKDLGVDLADITPTGPDGIITREDVHAAVAPAPGPATAAEPAKTAEPAETAETAGPAVTEGARETRVPVKGVRKATAAAMTASAFTAPHVTEFITVDVTRTMKLVEELKRDRDLAGLRVSPLLLICRALLVAIRRNPGANASWDEENQEIVQKHYVNLGIAAATPRGLIVPNIKDAHAMTLPELAAALGELVATAREGRTTPAAMRGGTVTVTNVGVFGVDTGTPILNPGEAAILAVGAIRLQPWVHKGKVKPRQVTTLGLSFDHRLVDGELGSRLLADTAAVLENPRRLITWG